MSLGRVNTQMFALSRPPSEEITVGDSAYRLVRVFKHDFFAATCLYAATGAGAFEKIVVKSGRTQPFCGIPMAWYGRLLHEHEKAIYRALAGVAGVPRWAGSVDETSFAIEYVDAEPLDHLDATPAGLFDRLRDIFDAIHARGVAYCDANKRSNILVAASGQVWLIDYQISLRRRDDWPRPLRGILSACIRSLQRADLYHLYKHKRRLAPGELTAEQERMSRRRSLLHTVHRKLTTPWRALRRRFLRRQYRTGRLVSPTTTLEDHYQPEKQTWRKK